MKKINSLLLLAALLIGLSGCNSSKPAEQISSIYAPSILTQTITDETSGTVTKIERIYSFEPPVLCDDGIIELYGKYSDNNESGNIIIFYTASGMLIGQREYPSIGRTEDYLSLADYQKDTVLRGCDVERQDGDTVYLKDGSYMVLKETNGVITNQNSYDANGTPTLTYKGNKWGMTEELSLVYSQEINDFTIKVEYNYIEILLP